MTEFFEPILNDSGKLTDGRLDTYETLAAQSVHIDTLGTGLGAARPFTHLFWIAEGVTGYSIGATGGNVLGVNPTFSTTTTDSSGETVSKVIDGKHYELYHWLHSGNIKHTAKTITVTFTGSNIKIYALWALNSVLEIDDNGFSRIEFSQLLSGIVQQSARGRESIAPGIAGQRDKHVINLTAQPKHLDRTDSVARAIHAFFAKYPEFVFSLEYERYPDLVFQAREGDRVVRSAYRSQWKALGRTSEFVIQEL